MGSGCSCFVGSALIGGGAIGAGLFTAGAMGSGLFTGGATGAGGSAGGTIFAGGATGSGLFTGCSTAAGSPASRANRRLYKWLNGKGLGAFGTFRLFADVCLIHIEL